MEKIIKKDEAILRNEIIEQTLIENVSIFIDGNEREVVKMLQHIIKNEIEKSKFVFTKELKEIIGVKDIKNFERTVSKAIREHYSQNSILRSIKYHFNREKIVSTFLYNVLENTKRELMNKNINLF